MDEDGYLTYACVLGDLRREKKYDCLPSSCLASQLTRYKDQRRASKMWSIFEAKFLSNVISEEQWCM
jgi:hypothetical protein